MSGKHLSRDKSESVPQPKAAAPKPVEAPVVTARVFTADQWARGRNTSLMRAFLTEEQFGRVSKRTAVEWAELYDAWLKKPR